MPVYSPVVNLSYQLSVISYQLSDVSFQFTDYCLLKNPISPIHNS
ncbi:conserved hypothetical protein [Microcystis sp. T1-4]|nr:hypothetical protein [Microcystis aeruginosa]CCI32642.1 conserved hypothetical protein [Microcystis sp. T1-4]